MRKDMWACYDGMPQLVSTVSLTDWYGNALRTISKMFVFFHGDYFLLQPGFATTARNSGK